MMETHYKPFWKKPAKCAIGGCIRPGKEVSQGFYDCLPACFAVIAVSLTAQGSLG